MSLISTIRGMFAGKDPEERVAFLSDRLPGLRDQLEEARLNLAAIQTETDSGNASLLLQGKDLRSSTELETARLRVSAIETAITSIEIELARQQKSVNDDRIERLQDEAAKIDEKRRDAYVRGIAHHLLAAHHFAHAVGSTVAMEMLHGSFRYIRGFSDESAFPREHPYAERLSELSREMQRLGATTEIRNNTLPNVPLIPLMDPEVRAEVQRLIDELRKENP